MRRLVFYLERYFRQLEADFRSEYGGLNLGQLWREGKHRMMLNLIAELPQSSRFAAAVATDEEHVEAILEAQKGQPEKEYAPPLTGWGTQNEQLAQVVDLLGGVIAVLVKANGGNPGKTKPAPRPRTAFAEVAERQATMRHKSTVELVERARKRARTVQ
jgi:hypothetical protein